MAVQELQVEGYRSVRSVSLRLGRVNVLVGPNGCGKSNLYRSLYLLACAAGGQFSRALADEGGMPSVLWAGSRKRNESARMTLGVTVDDLEYSLTCGLPKPQGGSMFNLDPMVREETVTYVAGGRVPLLERGNSSVSARDADGRRASYPMALGESESVLTQIREPHRFPHISRLRQEFLDWRFYHQFRTDADSPLRRPQVGIRTPILSHDGTDLAAALQTIREIGDTDALNEGIDRAFPGAELRVEESRTQFSLALEMPGFDRAFDARELSDGTLRYLCLLAALLSPRPPSLLALNEPETSIHPDLLEPLAHLIAGASRQSQLWVTTHSPALAEHLSRLTGAATIELEKVDGRTQVVGQSLLGYSREELE